MAQAQLEPTLTTLLVERWEQSSRKIAELAEAFPADRFESGPEEGMRTFGGVLRHVAFWNQYVADTLRGKQADDAANELPAAAFPDKAKVVGALKRSSDDVASALREREAPADLKAAGLAMSFVEHTSEHYGQLAVYARLNGIVPPASRT